MNSQDAKPPKVLQSINFQVIVLAVVALIVLFLGLGNSRLWDQDEGYFATSAAEMYARGDWIVPTYNGELFSHKPPMMYWGMMAGFQMFGVGEFGARFFSAVCGFGSVLLTFALGRLLFDARTAFFAALALLTSIFFGLVSRAATPDSHLTFFVTFALYVWLRGIRFNSQGLVDPSWSTWAMAYLLMGLAVLTKGPIGFLFPVAIIGLYMLLYSPISTIPTTERWSRVRNLWKRLGPVAFCLAVWRMRPFTAIAVMLLVAGPWYALVSLYTDGQFIREFFGVHHFGRFSKSMDNHNGTVFYYVLACLVGTYPWSGFAIPVAIHDFKTAHRDIQQRRGIVFAACWVGVYLVIFSMASTKLPNYVLPAYPALALLIGKYFATWSANPSELGRGWMVTALLLLNVVGLVFLVGLPIAGFLPIDGQTVLGRAGVHDAIRDCVPVLAMIGVPLLLAGCIGLVAKLRSCDRIAVISFAASSILLSVIVWQAVVPRIDQLQAPQNIVQTIQQESGDETVDLVVFGHFRPSMVFYAGRPIRFIKSMRQLVLEVQSGTVQHLVLNQKDYDELKTRLAQAEHVMPTLQNQKPFVDYFDNQALVHVQPTESAANAKVASRVAEVKQTVDRR